MAVQQEAITLVGYKVDQSSVAAATQANKNVAASYDTLKQAVAGMSAETLALNPGLAQQAAQAGQVVTANTQLASTNVQLAGSYKAVAAEAERASRAQSGSRLASGFSTVRGLGSGIGSVTGSPIGGQVAAVAGIVSEFGVFGVAAAGAVLAIKAITDAEEKRAAAAVSAANDLNRIALEASRGATSESIKEQIAQEEAHRRVLEETQEKLQEQADKLAILKEVYEEGSISTQEYTVLMGRLAENVDVLTNGAVTAAGGVFDLGKLLEQNQENIDGATREIGLFNIQLGTSAVAANDATQEMERAWDEITDKLADKSNRLSKAIQDALDGVAAKTELATTQAQNYFDALDAEAKIREEMADTVARINEIIAERDERLLELADDNKERRLEIEADARDRLAEIVQDSMDRIAKIMRDAGREQFTAVAQRDAVALYQSQIRQADALADQKRADEKAVEQVRKTQEKQYAVADKGYQKQVAALEKSVDKQLGVQNKLYAQLQVDQMNAAKAAIDIAKNGSGGLVTVHTNMWSDINSVSVQWAANTVNTVRSIFGVGQAVGGVIGGVGGAVGGVLNARALDNRIDQRLNQTLRAAGF